MLPIRVDSAKEQDFRRGRGGVAVDTLVIHTTEGGSIAGAASWWDRDDVVASSHYIIDGRGIVARVTEADTALHAGNAAMNRRSIGIEVVGHAADPKTWSEEVLAQLVALSREILARHRIPVLHQAGPGICGHCDVPDPGNPNLRGGASHHKDPGPHFPWSRYLAGLQKPPTVDVS
jgi:N-acetyl-anhydromuramyl-L-alanine amidase AmpD